jgi:hypothetical protein
VTVGVEAVLRAQGLPSSARWRPPVVATAEWALSEGGPQLVPAHAARRFAIERVAHSRVLLAGGGTLTGPLPAAQLAAAREVAVVVATIGGAFGETISRVHVARPSRGLALEGLAIAGLEAWVAQVRGDLQAATAERGWHLTAALNPGMKGWPLGSGQRELFALLGDGGPVRLLEGGAMWPRHSLSFVVGLGPEPSDISLPCDRCDAKARCRHRPSPEI